MATDVLSVKNYVWVTQPNESELYVKGTVDEYYEDENGVKMAKVTISKNNQEFTQIVRHDEIELCNPAKFNKCPDMAELTHLNEPSVVYNLYLRYNDDMIYTYSGLFLVAINPYKNLNIYDSKTLLKYHNHDFEKAPPHIFATAEGTYRNLLANNKDQSILVTGESGAGKTENTKKIIQYLSSITDKSKRLSSYGQNIDGKILQANPILESFGNAKTLKNNNSSRFGKFIRIFFSPRGSITGANVDYYLLEKSRVTTQLVEERNYHIFYQFLKGYEDLHKFGLTKNVANYRYLSNDVDIPNLDDKKEFNLLVEAFKILGLTWQELDKIFSILAVVLHLGNLDFTSWKAEQASFTESSPVDQIVKILGISKNDFTNNLLQPKVKAGREFVQKSKKASEVKYAIDALAKHLYEKLFQHIIKIINQNLQIDSEIDDDFNFIGVLDIAGFEIFDTNSFEQLCINYTNEKLQQFFNHHSFILEQSEYLREDIQWEFIDFGQDLQPTIDLIETRQPMGIFKILDEECMMPKSSDKSFIENLGKSWGEGQSSKFKLNKFKSGFIIHHYAGMVEYNVDNWLQKNTDPVNENVLKLLPKSSNSFIVELIEDDEHLIEPSNNKRGSRIKTASLKHKDQLSDLMEQLGSTEPSFVRCILPNLNKKPNKFDKKLVLSQLRCNGVLEGIRITRAGYPNRMTFEEFEQRYSIIDTKEVFTKNAKTNSELILKCMDLDVDSYRVGITKIFFKNGILGILEEKREIALKQIFTGLQSIIRGKQARKILKEKIHKIQAGQLISKTFLQLENGIQNSPWLDLFIKIKPLLEDSVKVLDSQEMNENLKNVNLKLKDAESGKARLEVENDKLREQMSKLENEIISTTELIKRKDVDLEKLRSAGLKSEEKLSQLNSEILKVNDKHKNTLEQKLRADEELTIIDQKLKKSIAELDESKKKGNEANERIVELEAKIDLYNEEKHKIESELNNLRKENESLQNKLVNLQSRLDENTATNSDIMTLEKEILELKNTIKSNDALLILKETEAKSIERKFKSQNDIVAELNQKLKAAALESTQLKDVLDQKSKEIARNRKEYNMSISEVNMLNSRLENFDKVKKELELLRSKESEHLNRISALESELSRLKFENEEYIKEIEGLKAEVETNAKVKTEYQDRIITLKGRLTDLEELKKNITNNKENYPPDRSLVDEFASMKLKLNEQSAALRKERFENRKTTEELNILKDRIAKGSIQEFSPRKSDYISNKSSDSKILTQEIESLKTRLKQEEANSQRAESYAIQLQKKFNQLQSTRGLSGSTDYEKKYKESQTRIAELESRFEQLMNGEIPNNSSSFSRSVLSPGLQNASHDFITVYQDITKTLKTTREELNISKAEILRLKKLLRESEDELYETKKESFKTSLSSYEQNLAELSVKYDSLRSKNIDLSESLQLFKKRASDYYKELEVAESAVIISKKREEEAVKELEEVKSQLRLAREESRSAQILIKQLRIQVASLQELVLDKNHEILKHQSQIKELNDKITYSDSYENKQTAQKHKDEIRELHKELNFKMESETVLVKENKKLQLDLEEITRIKNSLEDEYNQKLLDEEQLQITVSDLSSKNHGLQNERVLNERKISNLSKQVISLKELVDEISRERDRLLEVKANLETEVDKVTNELDEQTIKLQQKEADNIVLKQHLTNIQDESDSIKTELNQSKLGSTNDVEDYQKLRREHYITTEENDSLKKVNKELNQKVTSLEDKLYSNEQIKFWEAKVKSLTDNLDASQQENYDKSKTIKVLERQVKQLEIRLDNESRTSKKYNDENFDFQNKVSQYKSVIDILQNEATEKDLVLKSSERENLDLKENILQLEKELLQCKEKLGLTD